MYSSEYFRATANFRPSISKELHAVWRRLQDTAYRKFPSFEPPDDLAPIVSFKTPSSTVRVGESATVVVNSYELARESVLFDLAFFRGARDCLFGTERLIRRDMVAALAANRHVREAAALIVAAEREWLSKQNANKFDGLIEATRTSGGEILPDDDHDFVKAPLDVYSFYQTGFVVAHELAHSILREMPQSKQYAETLLEQLLEWCNAHTGRIQEMPADIWSYEIVLFDSNMFTALMSAAGNMSMLEEIPNVLARDPAAREEVLCDIIAQELMEDIVPLPMEPDRIIAFETLAGLNCAYWKWLALAKLKYLSFFEGSEERFNPHFCTRQVRNFLHYAHLERKKAEIERRDPTSLDFMRKMAEVFGGTLRRLYACKQEVVFFAECTTATVLERAIVSFGAALRDISDEELSLCIDDWLMGDVDRDHWHGLARDRPPFRDSALGRLCEQRGFWSGRFNR